MDMMLYKQLVGAAVAGYRGYTEDVKASISQYTRALSSFQVLEVDSSNIVSSSWSASGLYCEPMPLAKANPTDTPVSFLELHDGSTVVVFSNAAARHYTAAGDLIGQLPFKYATPASGADATNYFTPSSAGAVHFSSIVGNTELPGSVVLISVPASHIVQAYMFRAGVWTHAFTLGTIGTAGNGDGPLLAYPGAVAGAWVLRGGSRMLRIIVACDDTSATGSNNFLKEVVTDLAGSSLLVSREISYAGQYGGTGSLVSAEVDNARGLYLSETGQLTLVNSTDEVGTLQLSDDITLSANKTVVLKKGSMGALPYNDEQSDLTSVATQEGFTAVSDSTGHVFLLQGFGSAIGQMGKDRIPLVSATYPFEIGSINSLSFRSNGELVICASSGVVYRSNLASISAQEVVFSRIVPMDCRLEKHAGFNKGVVEFSIDAGLTYHPIEFFELKTIPALTVLNVRVRQSVEEAKENKDTITDGLVIVSV